MNNTNTSFKSGVFSLIAVQIGSNCGPHIKKILSQEWYFFNDWYYLKDGEIIPREGSDYIRTLYGSNVTVQAIVGMNGCGKSSLVELIYRMANNLSLAMTSCLFSRKTTRSLCFVQDIDATLYFEFNHKLGRLICKDNEVTFVWDNFPAMNFLYYKQLASIKRIHDADDLSDTEKIELRNKDKQNLEFVSRHFCYFIINNYSLFSLNRSSFLYDRCISTNDNHIAENGEWIDGLYNSGSDYQIPVSVLPKRNENTLNLLEIEKEGTEQLLAVLIDSHNKKSPFFDKYSYGEIKISFHGVTIVPSVYSRYIKIISKNNEIYKTVFYYIIKCFGFGDLDFQSDRIIRDATFYLAAQVIKIADTSHGFKDYATLNQYNFLTDSLEKIDSQRKRRFNNKKGYEEFDFIPIDEMFSRLCRLILNDQTSTSLHFRQTYHFLQSISKKGIGSVEKYIADAKISNYDSFINAFYDDKTFEKTTEILEFLPPPIFEFEIILNRIENNGQTSDVSISDLSTGEKQLLQLVMPIIFHLKNIICENDKPELAKYYNATIFMDEIEMCFHPNYQRSFLALFLKLLSIHEITKSCNINILIATHSPFILSDLCKSNILYLENGKTAINTCEFVDPFCANISDILRQSFFLSEGFMGEFVKSKIKDLLVYLNNETSCEFSWDETNSREFISLIGEPLLKNSLMNLYNDKFNEKDQDKLIAWHQKEIERIKKAKNAKANN